MKFNEKTTLLEALKEGCSITFPSGFVFIGLPIGEYIQMGYNIEGRFYPEGLYNLDEGGLYNALCDEERFRNQQNQIQNDQ